MPAFFLIFLLLLSCSDDLFYNEAMPHVSVEVQNRSDTIQVNTTVFFHAKMNFPRTNIRYYSWVIGDSTYRYKDSLRHKFEDHGLYNAKFHVTDHFGDTNSTDLFIRVSSPPICEKNLSLDSIYGSPFFKWKCKSTDPDDILTYNFKLINNMKRDTTIIILKKDSLLLGHRLPESWEAHLIATNNYGFKDSIVRSTE